MEHINGVWMPIGIFAMLLLGGVIKLIRKPTVIEAYRENTQPRPDYAVPTRPVNFTGSQAISDEQESSVTAKGHVAAIPSAPHAVAMRHSVANYTYRKQRTRDTLSDACNPLPNHRSNQYSS